MNITGGIHNGRKIQAPDKKIVRPTLSKVRMSVFNVLYSILGGFEGKSFLDMYGGSGIMGLEALSRGFSEVTVYEKNKTVAQIIKSNYEILGYKPDIRIGDSLRLAQTENRKYDVVFIDPPYMSGIYEDSLRYAPIDNIIVLEHTEDIDLSGYNILKQKKYGDKYLSFVNNM